QRYDNLKSTPRPGHADFVSLKKFRGFADPRGGGHHSGRVTLGLVIAGVIAKKITPNVEYRAQILSIGGERRWEEKLEEALERGDSLGGIIECVVKNVPVGLGNPFFDSVESLLSHIVFAIPGVRAIEFGDGFKASSMWGSQHNDPIVESGGKTLRNASGGINGGITNGNPILFRVGVKPTSSISLPQETLNLESGKIEPLVVEGRHDTSFALRVPVILEAVSAIAIANLILEGTPS
ncbi:MAG: chorismate synthase, partial [Bacteroidales bacterium]